MLVMLGSLLSVLCVPSILVLHGTFCCDTALHEAVHESSQLTIIIIIIITIMCMCKDMCHEHVRVILDALHLLRSLRSVLEVSP